MPTPTSAPAATRLSSPKSSVPKRVVDGCAVVEQHDARPAPAFSQPSPATDATVRLDRLVIGALHRRRDHLGRNVGAVGPVRNFFGEVIASAGTAVADQARLNALRSRRSSPHSRRALRSARISSAAARAIHSGIIAAAWGRPPPSWIIDDVDLSAQSRTLLEAGTSARMDV